MMVIYHIQNAYNLCTQHTQLNTQKYTIESPFKIVVVVNYCFTSLFGTNGLLSDIVVR